MEKNRTYLDRLPRWARAIGDAQKGEIEILLQDRIAPETGVVFEDDYVLVVRDAVRFPRGREGTYLRIFEKADLSGASGSVCVPISDRRLYLLRVYRHATRRWELEFPRGSRTEGEESLVTAQREVQEELGLTTLSVERIGEICPNTGLLAGAADVFLVKVATGIPVPTPDEQEAIGEVITVDASQIRTLIASGAIRDAHTLGALMLAQATGVLEI